MTRQRRAAWAAVGLVLDRVFGEPPTRMHPIAAFGSAMVRLEGRLPEPLRALLPHPLTKTHHIINIVRYKKRS